MKQVILFIILIAVAVGGVMWLKKHGGESAPKPAEEKSATAEAKSNVDTNGNAIVKIDAETQKRLALKVESLTATNLSPEVKGYGRILDPAPLAALLTELASARAACAVSSNEFERVKTLQGQGNASARALQTTEAAALHDQLMLQSATDRLMLTWGKAVAEHDNLPAFIQSLATLDAVLARIDLPAGQTMNATPVSARLVALSDKSAEAQFLGGAMGVDPQTQGEGFIFEVRPNSSRFLPGEAVTGYLKVSGEPLAGVVVPRDAVVRTEGKGWVYFQSGDTAFTRKEINLERATENGWFVTNGLSANDRVVIVGAQSLLSEELKASSPPPD